MKFKQIEQTDKFKKDLKKLLKRFPSLKEDLDSLVKAQLIAYHKFQVDNHGIFVIENLSIENPKIFKVKKFACKSLKGKGVQSGIRLIYAYFSIEDKIEKRIFEGRPNAQHSAAEALALCWMCLTSARRRLPVDFEMIYKAPLTSLSSQHDSEGIYGMNSYCSFALPTSYGRAKTYISNSLFEYLSAINSASQGCRKNIVHYPQRTLERSLHDIIQRIPEAQRLGKITFLTFMSLPHEIIGQRFKSIFLSHS